MIDIKRLNALYAATTQGDWQRCMANSGTCQCGLVWSSDLDAVVANCGSDPLLAEEVPKITDEEMVANSAWVGASHNAWPAVAARLALLEEFVQRVEASRVAEPFDVCDALDWLEAETKKAGE